MLDGRFRAGARRVAKAGLSLDVWAYHTQLIEVADLAASLSDLVVVVDHAGGPLGVGRHAGSRPRASPSGGRRCCGWRPCPTYA